MGRNKYIETGNEFFYNGSRVVIDSVRDTCVSVWGLSSTINKELLRGIELSEGLLHELGFDISGEFYKYISGPEKITFKLNRSHLSIGIAETYHIDGSQERIHYLHELQQYFRRSTGMKLYRINQPEDGPAFEIRKGEIIRLSMGKRYLMYSISKP